MIMFDTNKLRGAVGFTLQARAWGNRRKADTSKITTDSDKTRLKLSKELIQAEEYEKIKSFIGELRAWIATRTVPSFFRDGFQLASLKAVGEIEERMKKAEGELRALVDSLVMVYPAKIEEARVALNSQFDEKDYPLAEQLNKLFSIDWNWISFTIPEDLPAELREAEANKLQKKFSDAGEQITEALRIGFQELIAHAMERLTPNDDGKQKVFRESLVGNIQEFIDTFYQRNLMNDTELEQLLSKAQEILIGVSPDDLRKKADVREETMKQFGEIKKSLDTMIETRKSRRFDLE